MNEYEDKMTLVLEEPIKAGDVEYKSLDLQQPKAGQVEEAYAHPNKVTQTIILISLIAKVPKSAVREMTQRDFMRASDFLGHFNDDFQETSETSSQT